MKNARKYNIKLLVSISTLIVVFIWIAWLIKYNPYSYKKPNTTQSDTLDQVIQATNNWREQIKESQQQLELLNKFIDNQQKTITNNSSSTRKDLETSSELINSMKEYLSSSTVTTTPF